MQILRIPADALCNFIRCTETYVQLIVQPMHSIWPCWRGTLHAVGSLARLWDTTPWKIVLLTYAREQASKATNKSLPSSNCSHQTIYASGVNEQLVMERTGHCLLSNSRTFPTFSATRKGHAVMLNINHRQQLSLNSQHTSYHHLPTTYASQIKNYRFI